MLRHYLLLTLIALAVFAGAASFQHWPGYMDADYYLLTGQQMAEGRGLTEPILWNYLDNPSGLPHPSHAYWMPLASFVSAISLLLFPSFGAFLAGRVVAILLAALIPALTAKLTFGLSKNKSTAMLSGGFAILSVFYLPYLVTTDTFALAIVIGALFCLTLVAMEETKPSSFNYMLLGIFAGLLHLARAEGFIWLAVALLAAGRLRPNLRGLALTTAGYLLVMGPWFIRNWLVFGAPFATGLFRSLWLTNYDQLFAYPASQLTLETWLASGWQAILGARFQALLLNLQSALAVEGAIVLAPLIIWGAWRLRDRPVVRLAAVAWIVLLGVMSFVFPFSGARGGFFHAAATLQPMLWAGAAIGLDAFVEWGAEKRGWRRDQAWRVFSLTTLVILLGLTCFVFYSRVVGHTADISAWNASADAYVDLGEVLNERGFSSDAIVMANNPPGFSLTTGYPAIVIPDGAIAVALAVADRYGAEVLLLEANHPSGLNGLYLQPEDLPGLSYIATLHGTHIFSFTK